MADLMRALKELGVTVEKPSTGSHWRARRPGARCYTIPAHNGMKTKVTRKWLRGMCATLGLDIVLLEQYL